MKKILKLIVVLFLVSFFINSCKKETKTTPEKVLTFNELIIGKWVTNNTVYYKYLADSTGTTWDTSENVTELEGQKFTWNINKSILNQTHIMEVGGNVPKVYTITTLNSTSLVYKDDFGKVTTFTKVP
jgi:hypothetical protein